MRRPYWGYKMSRQSKFNLDMTLTDIPVKDTENPQLEKQGGDLLQWRKDRESLEALEQTIINLVKQLYRLQGLVPIRREKVCYESLPQEMEELKMGEG